MAGDSRVHHPTSENDSLLIYRDKDKVFGGMIMCIVLTACGVLATVIPDHNSSGAGVGIVGPLYAAIMGATTIVSVQRLISSAPALVINHTGIFINAAPFSIGPIEWSEIAELRALHVGFQHRLIIEVTEPRAIFERQSALRRVIYALIKGNPVRSGRIVTADGLLPISVYELLAEIREHFQHELSHNQIVILEPPRKRAVATAHRALERGLSHTAKEHEGAALDEEGDEDGRGEGGSNAKGYQEGAEDEEKAAEGE